MESEGEAAPVESERPQCSSTLSVSKQTGPAPLHDGLDLKQLWGNQSMVSNLDGW